MKSDKLTGTLGRRYTPLAYPAAAGSTGTVGTSDSVVVNRHVAIVIDSVGVVGGRPGANDLAGGRVAGGQHGGCATTRALTRIELWMRKEREILRMVRR